MESNRAFRGVWITAEVWNDRDLSWMEKLFLADIDSLAGEGWCDATNGYFQKFFNRSKSRVSEIINSLKNKGFIVIEFEMDGKQVTKRLMKSATERGIPENRTGYTGKPVGDNYIYTKSSRGDNIRKEEINKEEVAERGVSDHASVLGCFLEMMLSKHGVEKGRDSTWITKTRASIQKMTMQGISADRQRTALGYYQDNDFWTPITTGKDLEQHLIQLLDYHKKSLQPKKQDQGLDALSALRGE